MKITNPFKTKPRPGPFAARVIVGDATHRPATIGHYRATSRDHHFGEVHEECITLIRPGQSAMMLGHFGDN